MKLRRGKYIFIIPACVCIIGLLITYVHALVHSCAPQGIDTKGLLIRRTNLMRFERFAECT